MQAISQQPNRMLAIYGLSNLYHFMARLLLHLIDRFLDGGVLFFWFSFRFRGSI